MRLCFVNASSLGKSSAVIKQHVNTPVVHPVVFLPPKHVLVSHRAHSFINVQPTLPVTAFSVLVKNVDSIVPATWRLVVVKCPVKLVVHRLGRFPGSRYHDFWIDRDTSAF